MRILALVDVATFSEMNRLTLPLGLLGGFAFNALAVTVCDLRAARDASACADSCASSSRFVVGAATEAWRSASYPTMATTMQSSNTTAEAVICQAVRLCAAMPLMRSRMAPR